MSEQPTPDASLDTRGLTCPEPLMLVRHRMRALPKGTVLEILATDPSTERDFSNYCRFVGHELLAVTEHDGELRFLLKHQG